MQMSFYGNENGYAENRKESRREKIESILPEEIDIFPTPQIDRVERFANATLEASKTARKTLLWLIFSSVIVFFGYWNTRPDSWADLRYNKICQLYDSLMVNDSLPKGKEFSSKVNKILALKDTTLNPYIRNHSKNSADLKEYRDIYFNLEKESYTVKTPLFGINLDANDLGIYSGLVFSVLFLFLWFCLDTENKNIIRTLTEAKNINIEVLAFYYHFLAMGQILTVPKEISPENIDAQLSLEFGREPVSVRLKLFRLLTKYTIIIPFVVQILICWNDYSTRQLGTSIDAEATHFLMMYSLVSLVIVGILFFMCFKQAQRTDKIWDIFYYTLKNDVNNNQ